MHTLHCPTFISEPETRVWSIPVLQQGSVSGWEFFPSGWQTSTSEPSRDQIHIDVHQIMDSAFTCKHCSLSPCQTPTLGFCVLCSVCLFSSQLFRLSFDTWNLQIRVSAALSAGFTIVVSPGFLTFPWVYSRFTLLIFPTTQTLLSLPHNRCKMCQSSSCFFMRPAGHWACHTCPDRISLLLLTSVMQLQVWWEWQ